MFSTKLHQEISKINRIQKSFYFNTWFKIMEGKVFLWRMMVNIKTTNTEYISNINLFYENVRVSIGFEAVIAQTALEKFRQYCATRGGGGISLICKPINVNTSGGTSHRNGESSIKIFGSKRRKMRTTSLRFRFIFVRVTYYFVYVNVFDIRMCWSVVNIWSGH